MPEPHPSLKDALASYDRDLDKDHVLQAERERKELLERFPLEQWPTLPLERYALGQEDSKDTFCRWMEFRTQHVGSIRGGSSRKLIIYKHKDKPGWYFDSEYKNEQEAWLKVRDAFVQAFQKAKANDWNTIADLAPLQSGPALLLKALHIYFPEEILSIYSERHIRHFLRMLGCSEANDRSLDVVRLNRALYAAARLHSEFNGWTSKEIERFFYRWADPREQRRVVKIAPGEDARFWEDCLREGYICVGWDDVGDLREFESKESFRAQFEQSFAELYKNHKPTLSKKANELWTLMELEPGDIVIANKGTSHVLAIGEVAEPGYEWNPKRPDFRHTVRTEWDTSYAKEIPPQKKWALVTVSSIPPALYEAIVGEAPRKAPVVPLDPIFHDIGEALERKHQVILYGPPGTGKTYQARRFAIAWLLQHYGRATEVQEVLSDPGKFEAAEHNLSTVQVSKHVWWIVANPKEWSWDRLFKEKRVSY